LLHLHTLLFCRYRLHCYCLLYVTFYLHYLVTHFTLLCITFTVYLPFVCSTYIRCYHHFLVDTTLHYVDDVPLFTCTLPAICYGYRGATPLPDFAVIRCHYCHLPVFVRCLPCHIAIVPYRCYTVHLHHLLQLVVPVLRCCCSHCIRLPVLPTTVTVDLLPYLPLRFYLPLRCYVTTVTTAVTTAVLPAVTVRSVVPPVPRYYTLLFTLFCCMITVARYCNALLPFCLLITLHLRGLGLRITFPAACRLPLPCRLHCVCRCTVTLRLLRFCCFYRYRSTFYYVTVTVTLIPLLPPLPFPVTAYYGLPLLLRRWSALPFGCFCCLFVDHPFYLLLFVLELLFAFTSRLMIPSIPFPLFHLLMMIHLFIY